jgi:hypothetical protein
MHYLTILASSGVDLEVVVVILRVARDFPFPPFEDFEVFLAIFQKDFKFYNENYFTFLTRSAPALVVDVVLRVPRDFPFLPPEIFLFVLAMMNKIWGVKMPEFRAFVIGKIN